MDSNSEQTVKQGCFSEEAVVSVPGRLGQFR
jgi:hypothetical protein